MKKKSDEEKLYDENFNLYYNDLKFAPSNKQEPLIIEFLKHLIYGYEKEYLTIKDIGGWCTSTVLSAKASEFKSYTFYSDLTKLGYRYGDSFDIGENEVREVWGTSWEEAEKIFIERLKKFIANYSN